VGSTIAVQSDVPTPWIAFRETLRLRRLSLDKVRAVVGLSTADAIDALTSGAVDYAVLHVDRSQHDAIEEVAALADVVGPVPWSVYLASRAAVEANPDPYRRFQRAIGRALRWMSANQSPAIAEATAPWFSSLGSAITASAIDRYRRLDAWPAQPQIRIDDVARWQEILIRWGLMVAPMALPPFLRFASATNQPNAHPAA
jgi:NitT/TauT family transport system substrate-binding protein